MFGAEENPPTQAKRVEVSQAEVQGLAAAHRQSGQGRFSRSAYTEYLALDVGDHVFEQIVLEIGESRRQSAKTFPSARSLTWARPLGMTTIIG